MYVCIMYGVVMYVESLTMKLLKAGMLCVPVYRAI